MYNTGQTNELILFQIYCFLMVFLNNRQTIKHIQLFIFILVNTIHLDKEYIGSKIML